MQMNYKGRLDEGCLVRAVLRTPARKFADAYGQSLQRPFEPLPYHFQTP